jgi:type III secretion protein F
MAILRSAGLNLDAVNNTIYAAINTQENKLKSNIAEIGQSADGSVSQAQLLMMQQDMGKWTIMIEIQTNLTKQIFDSAKSVIQKSS